MNQYSFPPGRSAAREKKNSSSFAKLVRLDTRGKYFDNFETLARLLARSLRGPLETPLP
ncbi:TPA: hypothetical protein HA244_02125 [Candidatus Micrarchaeota archaeon]|nr:hypothetical protein [Candidatus Micrarchaeota archaeon]